MRTGSAPFRPSGLASQPAEPETGDYLALEKGKLVVITPTTPQTKRGLLGALFRPRSDSKDLSSQSASLSKSRSSGSSSPVSSQSRSSVSEPLVPAPSGDEAGNRSLLTALTSYASRLKLPADATFHQDIGLLQRDCAVLPPQEFGRSALKIYAAAKAQAKEAPMDVEQVVATAVREARDRVMAGGAAFTVFADTIQTAKVLKAFGCRLECHQGRLVVLHSMEGLSRDEVRLAKRVDEGIRRGDASLTSEEEVFQSRRSANGKTFMMQTYAKGESHDEGLFGSPNVQGPIALEEVAAHKAANEPVLEAVTERLKEAGIGPALLAQLKDTMKPVLESPPELFAYRLASRTKSWDARVGMARSEAAARCFDPISRRLEQHMKAGSLVNAEAHMLTRYAQRAFSLALDQEMDVQVEATRRANKLKLLPPGTKLAELATMSVDELTDLAIMELRRADLKQLAGSLPPLAPPLPPELAAKYAGKDAK